MPAAALPRSRKPKAPPTPDTLADVLKALGDIPPSRILWTPFPGTATEADAVRLRRVELVDGILVEKPMGARESFIAMTLGIILGNFIRAHNLGVIGAADTLLRVLAGRNRLPDVSFTSWDRLPTADAHLQPVGDFAPDLAVEILSESNRPGEIALKIQDYLKGGTKLVWVFDPDTRSVTVYTSPKKSRRLTESDTLDGGKVLPGFTLPLADFWNEPQLNPRPER